MNGPRTHSAPTLVSLPHTVIYSSIRSHRFTEVMLTPLSNLYLKTFNVYFEHDNDVIFFQNFIVL